MSRNQGLAATLAGAEAAAGQDTAKRREILEGARRVFRAQGFDGASMGEIAKAAGVSKGTLYVYFDSKEALFEALVVEDRRDAAEQLFQLDERDPDVEGALRRLGTSFVHMMARPEHMAMVRMVLGSAEKLPDTARLFYEAGPKFGRQRLARYFDEQVAAGRLDIADTELAATQFLDLCKGAPCMALLFGSGEAPAPEAVERTIEGALHVFFAAYGPKKRGER